MKPELSALLDGELESHEARGILASLRDDESLRVAWSDYHLVGDALRDEGALACDVTARVMARLQSEPVVLAPRSIAQAGWWRPLMALAASLAGVAVVGWLAFAPQERDALPPAVVATVASAQPAASAPVMPVNATADSSGSQMQEYLAAHQAYAGGLQFQGSTQQIRTVSLAVTK
jgi:sigma-E factor negative regulatory protein RseA